MKNILLYIVIFLSMLASSYAQVKEAAQNYLLNDKKNWEKTKEESNFQEFTYIKNPKETITISLDLREKDPYLRKSYYEGPTDLFSLMSHEEFSSLQRMKELRLESKKTSSPYSVWRLLYAFNEDDVIYEYYVPSLGPYPFSYEITRLIKTEEGYLKITYHSLSEVSKESSIEWLKWLKELSSS